jgi:hypothetical protein
MIRVDSLGDWADTNRFLDRILHLNPRAKIESLAQQGVDALRSATPIESGLTAESWDYEILQNGSKISIWWSNTNNINGFKVAIGLQYGHGTNGGYVAGQDYINPALRPIFDRIANAVWEEVKKL